MAELGVVRSEFVNECLEVVTPFLAVTQFSDCGVGTLHEACEVGDIEPFDEPYAVVGWAYLLARNGKSVHDLSCQVFDAIIIVPGESLTRCPWCINLDGLPASLGSRVALSGEK